MTTLLLKLIAGHLAGDFFLQTDRLAKSKRTSVPALSLHALINAICVYMFLGNLSLWWVPPVVLVTHFIIDHIKIHYGTDSTKWFIADQCMHLAVLMSVWLTLTGGYGCLHDLLMSVINSDKIWMYLIVYSSMTLPTSMFIERVFRNWSTKVPEYNGLPGGGMWIGIIERWLIITFIVTGNFSAVGFLMTAKSVFRFADIKTSSDFRITEYILLGTLISFAIAIAGGLILL